MILDYPGGPGYLQGTLEMKEDIRRVRVRVMQCLKKIQLAIAVFEDEGEMWNTGAS